MEGGWGEEKGTLIRLISLQLMINPNARAPWSLSPWRPSRKAGRAPGCGKEHVWNQPPLGPATSTLTALWAEQVELIAAAPKGAPLAWLRDINRITTGRFSKSKELAPVWLDQWRANLDLVQLQSVVWNQAVQWKFVSYLWNIRIAHGKGSHV